MKHDYSGILHFFRTGQLGELRLGMHVDEVVGYLGKADSRITMPEDDPEYYEKLKKTYKLPDDLRRHIYGCLTLSFSDRLLISFKIDIESYPEHSLPEVLSINLIPLSSRMTLDNLWELSLKYGFELYENYRGFHNRSWQPLVVMPLCIRVEFVGFLCQIQHSTDFQLHPSAKRWIYTA